MARQRRAPRRRASKDTMYAWSDLYNGGESSETKLGRKIIHSRNIIARGDVVSQSDLDASDELWQHLQDTGSIRNYPLPDGYEGDAAEGQSPVTFVLEKHKAEMEAAEADAAAESIEDRIVRASVVGTQIFGPQPEDVLLGAELPEGVEEVDDNKNETENENEGKDES